MKRYVYSAKTNLNVDDFDFSRFDDYQISEIRKGLESGLDVSVYADPKFDVRQMYHIRKGLESGLDVSIYADPKFDQWQMYQIRYGLDDGLDVSVYADPKFNDGQMGEIRYGLEDGLDVSVYADPTKFSGSQMAEIRQGLKSGVDVSVYADPKFDNLQMQEIREGLESGVDVSVYADPKFDVVQMRRIRQRKSLKNRKSKWPRSLFSESNILDSEEFDELWQEYLSGPEGHVNDDLQIYPEPSTQGGQGSMVIFDDSDNEDKFAPIFYDFQDWCNQEARMAASSKNAKEYEAKYRAFVEDLISDRY